VRLEEQVTDISRNISILMVALASNLRSFREFGRSNSEIGSNGKSRDNEDPENESRKKTEKEQLISSVINPSQSLIKMEAKVEINPYQGEIDALQWICWHYFRQRQGKSVQEYTTKFKKIVIVLSISPKNPDVLLKYLKGLHSHL